MAEPVSWLLIRPGWKVLAADGSEAGAVDEVAGDMGADIFDGLAIATSALGRPRYVAAEQIASIEEGAVHLSLSPDEVEALGEYVEPATEARIEPDTKGGAGEAVAAAARKVESELVPPRRRPHRTNLAQRLVFLVRRLLGR